MATVAERPKADATITMRIPARTRELIDSAALPALVPADLGQGPPGDGDARGLPDDARLGHAAMGAAQRGIDPADMAGVGVAVRDHRLDARPLAPQCPSRRAPTARG